MTRQWRAIPGYEGFYEVSDDGLVRSIGRRVQVGGVRASTWVPSRQMSLVRAKTGYISVALSRAGVVTPARVHRLVLLAFIGPAPEGAQGCHNNGDPSDNRVENLRWDTPQANQADRRKHGTAFRTHCKNGHEFTEVNTLREAGVRRCRECRKKYMASYDASRSRDGAA